MSTKGKLYRTSIVRYSRVKWMILSRIPGWRGITNRQYDHEIVVSLTSFPARIHDVVYAIESILMQSMKPNRIVLWLADSQFPGKEASLPECLLHLQKYGLEIRWCEDLKSYKKLIPALCAYPEAIIVTADDDLHYVSSWLKKLYKGYQSDSSFIWVHRVTKFEYKNDQFYVKGGGRYYWKEPCYLNKLTGGAGALYPPRVLDADVLNKELFQSLCPTNDDIWFWLMAVKNHVKIAVVENPLIRLIFIGNTQEGETLASINDHGEKLFWKDFNHMLDYYPEIRKQLMREVKLRNENSCCNHTSGT